MSAEGRPGASHARSAELGRIEPGGGLEGLWQLVFPDRCVGCGARGTLLCAACQEALTWLPAASCPRCATASPKGGVCRRCAGRVGAPLASVRAACRFDGAVRRAIHGLKYRHARRLALLLARLVAVDLARRPLSADLTIPVPLSANRFRRRGFNQSELIARALGPLSGLPAPAPSALRRVRDTPPQVGLGAAERRRNLRGAFACPDPGAVAGRRCLLIDDVMTTGATIEACAEALHRAGAGLVLGLVVAREQ